MKKQYWLAELDRFDNPKLVDGPHSGPEGAEMAYSIISSIVVKNHHRKLAMVEVKILKEYPAGVEEEFDMEKYLNPVDLAKEKARMEEMKAASDILFGGKND